MGAYCLYRSESIPHERLITLFDRVFDPEQTSRTWRARLLEVLFESETAAQAFIDVSYNTFRGDNHALNKSDHDLLELPTKQLLDLCHNVLEDGPQIFRTVTSSPETFQKLISSMALACQRVRCFGNPDSEYGDMLATCLRTTRSVYDSPFSYQGPLVYFCDSILANLAGRAILDVRTCYLLLIPSLVLLRRWVTDSFRDIGECNVYLL